MSSIETKLRNFERAVINRAAHDRDIMLSEIDEQTQAAVAQTRAQYESRAAREYEKGLEEVRKEARLIVSTAKNDGQTQLVSKRNDITEDIFLELHDRLVEFTKSDEYERYFVRKLTEAVETASAHIRKAIQGRAPRVTIELTEADAARFEILVRNVCRAVLSSSDVRIEVSDDDIIGGCRIWLTQIGRAIDNTMSADVSREKASFLTWSGLSLK